MAFVVTSHHYLLECCWEKNPMGLPMARELRDKVATKAEGTFGVLLSLSGFTSDINVTVGRGARLNCVGLVHTQLVSVLEGRTTWADLVLSARALASTKGLFWGGSSS